MFYWLTFTAILLAAIVLFQSVKAERRAHKNRLEAIRKRIEENECKKKEKQMKASFRRSHDSDD